MLRASIRSVFTGMIAVTAAVAGLLAAGIAFLLLMTMIGFLAIGLLGLVVLVIANRMEIDDGHAIAEIRQSAATVRLVALQMAERERTAADRRPALAAERRRRRLALHVARTFGIALTALGFSMFYLHQL